MGEHWDPWNQGAQQGGRWGPPPADDRGEVPPTPGGHSSGGYSPGGYSPGGYSPGGYSPGGSPPAGFSGDSPGGFRPGGFSPEGFGPEGFGPAGGGTAQLSDSDLVGSPPTIWLIAALVLGLAAAAVAVLLGASVGYAFGAWVLAGPVAIGLLAVFAQRDVRRRALPIYNAPTWLPALYWSAVVAAGLGICLSAWKIALWAGHL